LEMFLGMAIMTLVVGAMSAFCLAMTSAWHTSEKSASITLKGQQIALRLANTNSDSGGAARHWAEMRQAKLLGACRAGSSDGSAAGAAILIWKTDTNNDGYIQGNEVEMIEHDTTNHTLKLYYTGQADASGTWSYSTNFTVAGTIDQFKIGRSSREIATGIYGAVFQTSNTGSSTIKPSFQYALKLMTNQSQTNVATFSAVGGEPKLMVQYGTITLRSPIAAPNN